MICKSDESDRRPLIIQTTAKNKENENSNNNLISPLNNHILSPAEKAEKDRLNNLENVYLEMKGELNVLRHLSTSQLQKSPPQQVVAPQTLTPAGDIYYLAAPQNNASVNDNNDNINNDNNSYNSRKEHSGTLHRSTVNQNRRLVTPDKNQNDLKSSLSSNQSNRYLGRKHSQLQV